MIVLPIAAFVLFTLLQPRTARAREAWVRGAVVWGITLVAITEVLSAFSAFGTTGVAAMWTIAVVGAAFALWRRRLNVARPDGLRPRDGIEWVILAIIAAIVAVTLFTAISAAPATWDAHVYHLSRIEHWIQNRNVRPFPTQIPRQLWPGPGAEFIIAHLQLLAGTDRVVTLVQWLAFAANIVVASRIAAQLGASRRGQLFASFAVATMPGAIAQASGAQVELVSAFWVGCAVSLLLDLRSRPLNETSWTDALLLGGSIGLAILAKATAYLILGPFAIWLLIHTLRDFSAARLRTWLLAVAAALAVVAPQYARNYSVFGRPLGAEGADGAINESFSPGAMASNVVRNIALHFGTRSQSLDRLAYNTVVGVHKAIGVDVDDPRTTFPGERFQPIHIQYAEQTAGSPVLLLLFGVALVILALRKPRAPLPLVYAVAVASGFLFFCVLLKWQPWNARLHVPMLAIGAPIVGYVAGTIDRRWSVTLAAAAMTVGAMPALLLNPARPLLLHEPIYTIPRERQYFAEKPEWYRSYTGAANYLRTENCRRIGLKIGGNDFEYALWALLERRFHGRPMIRHVQVSTAAAHGVAARQERFEPCAFVYIHSAPRQRPFVVPGGFQLAWQKDSVRVFIAAQR